MTDKTAPERIWALITGIQPKDGSAGIWASGKDAHVGAEAEYIRADLGSFYQEKDIDAMQYEIRRLRAALESIWKVAAMDGREALIDAEARCWIEVEARTALFDKAPDT
jgi:hypothetical protein